MEHAEITLKKKVLKNVRSFLSFNKTEKTVKMLNDSSKSILVPQNEIQKAFFEEVRHIYNNTQKWLIEKPELSKEIIKREKALKDLGFVNSVPAEKLKSLLSENRLKLSNYKEQSRITNAIIYFTRKYPQYKFITKERIIELCEKYNLYFGNALLFVGNIPEKNIQEMINFKIAAKDRAYLTSTSSTRTVSAKDPHANNPHPFEIAAPIKEFNRSQVSTFGRYLDIPDITKPAEDPIVFCPVMFEDEKFYLIVTAWGEEASDPDVVNETFN